MKITHVRLYCTVVFIFISIITYAQTPKKYESAWKKIDSLSEKGLNKSALTEVNKIYAQASKEKNDVQLIKALIYQMQLNEDLEEKANEKNLKQIEKEIVTASEPAKSILESIAAGSYWNYFRQNRWRLYSRTQTANFVKDDIATWGITDFHKKITALYLESIRNEKLLQQTELTNYDPIIIKGNVRYLRPTLYDLLANQALEYFEDDERDIIRPAYQFQITENAAFDPATDFVNFKFKTQDSASLLFQALLIHQKLIQFHLDDKKPDALVDADLSRLKFVKQYSVISEKDSIYRLALQHIISIYDNHPVSSSIRFELANDYASNELYEIAESRYPANKNSLQKAKRICDETILKFPKTDGAIQCGNLLKRILQKTVSTTVELVNLPGEPFRALVKYKNIPKVYLRVIKYDRQMDEQLINRYQDSYWKKLVKVGAIKSWEQSIPVTTDYLAHSVEIKIDPLPIGEYALISSDHSDFSDSSAVLSQVNFHVSGISLIGKENEHFLLDRKAGTPLGGAEVQIWQEVYDNKKNEFKLEKAEKFRCDNNGYFRINSPSKNVRNIQFEISYKKDHLFIRYNETVLPVVYQNTESQTSDVRPGNLFFFTDRSIYRPGQTIFFKGIGMVRAPEKGAALAKAGDSVKILFRNSNNVDIDSLTLKFNEFGSVRGEFHAPLNQLNGIYSLVAKDYSPGLETISIEEYKRPKFYVELDQPTSTFKVNDTIKIIGSAKAYAGNNINGAKISYRVTRTVRFEPWTWMFVKRVPNYEEMEIASGTFTADENGKFTIPFKAIPDLNVDKDMNPEFNYDVQVVVTDINGESRDLTSSVVVGYKSMIINVELDPSVPGDVDSLKAIPIVTKNLAGVPVPAKATLKIYKLIPPSRLIRTRYWPAPDQFIYSEQEFVKYFPVDEYKEETNYQNWEESSLVFSDTITTGPSSSIPIPAGTLKPGRYVVESSALDENGVAVNAVNYFETYNRKDKALPSQQYFSAMILKDKAEPGEMAKWMYGSSADNIYIIRESNRNPVDSSKRFSFQNLNHTMEEESIPVFEKDRGGFSTQVFFVKDNRFYHSLLFVDVPWTNKDLKVSLITYRDKMETGSLEKWKLKITGNKKEKVAAEVLSSMYDASLDQFKSHEWSSPNLYSNNYFRSFWSATQGFDASNPFEKEIPFYEAGLFNKNYDQLSFNRVVTNPYGRKMKTAASMAVKDEEFSKLPNSSAFSLPVADTTTPNSQGYNGAKKNENEGDQSNIKNSENNAGFIRKNFNETVFFLPDLKTDSSGDIEFSFTMPDALTTWKLQALAHTKDLAFGYLQKPVVTQKQLMVQPNPPRFLREGDKIEISAKLANLSDKEITGNATLQLIDPESNQPVDGWFQNIFPVQYFTIAANQSSATNFTITVPYNYNKPVLYRIVAKAGEFSDGEENVLPVLANRTLVTESVPLNMHGITQREFKFEKLLQNNSETLHSQSLTVEFSSNPAWYVVQALPYLMEYPYECAEQTFNRYYANALATKIANSSPRVRAIFESWKNSDTSAFLSNLQKNEELKSVLLEETPWVLAAQNESAQKKNIGLLFDMIRMSNELEANFKKLFDMQSPNGGFVWFKGGPDDRYMTQYILSGIGHLRKLNAIPDNQLESLSGHINQGLLYLDEKIKSAYDNLVKSKVDMGKNHLSYSAIQYLYARSFYKDRKIYSLSEKANAYYQSQAKKYWTKESRYMQGMIALALYRNGDIKTASGIIASLKENSITSDELGMYWKENRGGYYWYEAPIETQALLIEAFSEIGSNTKSVSDMKFWLLKQKQTQNWETTKASAEACYAMLMKGGDWLKSTPSVEIDLGNQKIQSPKNAEAGTGYFKTTIPGNDVKNEMGNIRVVISKGPKDSSTTSWGAVYWQYFENLDKISPSNSPLQIRKKLFLEKNSDRGPVLEPINEESELKPGDKIIVRIELESNRDMEYVHLKDMRASGTEPLNVLSSYKWQGGLGYYETTKDASTNFFFSWINKGTYVFEYPLYISQAGNFSVGIATVQCMYAPEFTSHSEGMRIRVKGL